MNFLESVGFLAIFVVIWLVYLTQSRVKLSSRLEGALILLTIYAIYLVLASVWTGATSLFVSPTATPHSPRSTITPKPAELTFEAFYTQRNQPAQPSQSSCLIWSQITRAMAGSTACIYGVVTDHRENWQNSLTTLYFGDPEQFFLVSNFRWNQSLEGQCVSVTGQIQLNTYQTPYTLVSANWIG